MPTRYQNLRPWSAEVTNSIFCDSPISYFGPGIVMSMTFSKNIFYVDKINRLKSIKHVPRHV